VIEYSDFNPFKDVLFLQLIIPGPYAHFLLGLWILLRPNTSLVYEYKWVGPRCSRSNNSIVTTIFASVRPSNSKNATTRPPLDGYREILYRMIILKSNKIFQFG